MRASSFALRSTTRATGAAQKTHSTEQAPARTCGRRPIKSSERENNERDANAAHSPSKTTRKLKAHHSASLPSCAIYVRASPLQHNGQPTKKREITNTLVSVLSLKIFEESALFTYIAFPPCADCATFNASTFGRLFIYPVALRREEL